MNGIFDEIKDSFRRGGTLIQLIYINLAVFLVVKLIFVFLFMGNMSDSTTAVVRFLALPASLPVLITKPWTLITYMFLHTRFLHILFNLLWLYWFGKIFLMYLTPKQMLSVYILGGLSGAALYILAYNTLPVFENILPVSYALGASAAVMAIGIATAVYLPDFTINLMFIGQVKLKYLAMVFVVLDILSIASDNAGGHIAHLGGALFGYLYIVQYRKGKDLGKGFNNMMDGVVSLFSSRKKMHVTYRKTEKIKEETDWDYNKRKREEQKTIDEILEKIAKSGYESLSKKEKEILFKASK
ncbi:MAG: rhomboid family intramembrane serine protease [Bacteroidota bacterium]